MTKDKYLDTGAIHGTANGRLVIAIDFDDTISTYEGWQGEGNYGTPIDGAREAINWLRSLGHYVIIWTCRNENSDVLKWLDQYNIGYDAINEDVAGFTGSPKIYADIYIDDKNPGWQNWKKTLEDIMNKHDIYQYYLDETLSCTH